jgi:hypothetical protein
LLSISSAAVQSMGSAADDMDLPFEPHLAASFQDCSSYPVRAVSSQAVVVMCSVL